MIRILLCFLLTINLLFLHDKCYANESNATVSGKLTASDSKDAKVSQNFMARKYILGPNDIISINIYNIPTLAQQEVRVQPDGKINIAYFQNLSVAGKTIQELVETIKTKYSEYLVNPDVSVKLVQSRPFIVYVSGAIINPGSYELNTITNSSSYNSKPEAFIERKTPLLTNILLACGGLSYDSDLENIEITNDLDHSVYKANLLKLIKDGDSSQDIYLISGDRIKIPLLNTASKINVENYKLLSRSTLFEKDIPIRVIGYVNNPGLIRLNSSESNNLNSAIAAAGGYLKDSAYIPKNVYVSRGDRNNNTKLSTQAINPKENDFILMPNDIVYVPEKSRPLIGKAFDYASRIMMPFYVFSTGYSIWK